jgi:inner membrane transporter RhtA
VAQLDSPPLDVLGRAPSGALVLVAISSVQFGSAVATNLFGSVGPAGAVLLRLLFSSLVLLVIWRPAVRSRPRRELGLAVLFGLVLAGMNLTFYEALHRIPLGIAVTIEFVGPLGVAIAGSRRRIDLLWVGLAAAGIIALSHGGAHGLNGLGVAFALMAGCLWASYILVNARVGRAFERGTGLALALAVGAIALLPFGIAAGGSHLLEPRSLGLGLAVAMLSSAIPYSCELEALRRIRPALFGVLMSLEPGMAAFAGFLVLGQGLSVRSLLGIVLVVVASIGAARRSSEAAVAL